MKIFLCGMPEIHISIVEKVSTIPGIIVENNFQQVLGIAKANELERLCIYMDAWNGDESYLGIRGQTAAHSIHCVSPNVPILIWDGREYISDEDVAPVLKVTGKLKPIQFEHELYLSFDFYKNPVIFKLTRKFFEGQLTVKDVPHRECLDYKF